MRVAIATPAPVGSTKGNRITAERWAAFLARLGHEIQFVHSNNAFRDSHPSKIDCLIALHATRSHDVMLAYRRRCPNRPVVLCLTGTDLHLDWKGLRGDTAQRQAEASMQQCSHFVMLEPQSAHELPVEFQPKVHVIRQSAEPVSPAPQPLVDCFEICVVGHLRDVKDPFLTACAARHLPTASRIRITHLGAALSPEMEQLALDEMKGNPRYQWLGPIPHDEAQSHLARSRLMVLSSKVEGAPSAISEAIVNRVPILATRIQATIGLLGADYPGLFPVGDHLALLNLMTRAESDPSFLATLTRTVTELEPAFSPEVEFQAIASLFESIQKDLP